MSRSGMFQRNTKIRKLDGHKCRVWGCGSPDDLEVHHIIPRSQGGSNKSWNLITLCNKHHRLVTNNQLKDSTLLLKLVWKADFRWKKALEWHLNRDKIRIKVNES